MPIKYVLTFVLGAGVGGTIGYFATKKYFENYLNEEIDSVKDYYKNKAEKQENESEMTEKEPKLDKNDQKTEENEPNYKEIIEKMNYGSFSEKKKETTEVEEDATVQDNHRFVISADDYAGDFKYDKVGMTYYEKDGVFIDEDGDVVPNGIELIGEENLDKFGEYEEDSLFVRNTEMELDYEVILDDGAYADSLYEGYEDD